MDDAERPSWRVVFDAKRAEEDVGMQWRVAAI
jgi:hypothetical protein